MAAILSGFALSAAHSITITKGNFPVSLDKADQYLQALRASGPQQMANLSLAHLKAEIAVAQAESAPQQPVAVKNDVPKIYFSTQPAILVQVDGQPVARQAANVILPRMRDWMDTSSWIVNEIVIGFFLVMTMSGLENG